jgi:hypothetical protein
VLADALPPEVRSAFAARYEGRRPLIPLFDIALGLDRPPSALGLTHYYTVLIPEWVNSLSDYARRAEILADAPGTRTPPRVGRRRRCPVIALPYRDVVVVVVHRESDDRAVSWFERHRALCSPFQ